MYKTGIMFRNIVAGIIALILAGIILLIITNILREGDTIIDREACRTSVLLKAQSKLLDSPFYDDLNCKTNVHEINELDEEHIYNLLTFEMYDCWYQFGEGKRDFLEGWEFGYYDNWCWVCSRIDFDQNVQKEFPLLNGLANYLKTERVPLKEGEPTFFEYIYSDFSEELKKQPFEFEIKTSDPLYIVFFADKRVDSWLDQANTGSWIAIVSGVAGAVVGCVGGGFLGSFVVPVGGTLAGCGSGATSLGKAGFVLGLAAGGTYIAGAKPDFYNGLYVGSDSEVLGACNQ